MLHNCEVMGQSNQVHQLKLLQMITLMKNSEFCKDIKKCKSCNIYHIPSANPEGGTGGPDPPPLRFVKGGVLCRGLMGRRGCPTVVFTYYYQFFSGSLRSQVLYKHITCIHASKFNVQYGTVILSLYFSFIQLWKESQLPTPCFNERVFSYCSCPELHDFNPFKKKKFWGRTPWPSSPTHIQYQSYHVICVFMSRGAWNYTKDHALPKNKLECK